MQLDPVDNLKCRMDAGNRAATDRAENMQWHSSPSVCTSKLSFISVCSLDALHLQAKIFIVDWQGMEQSPFICFSLNLRTSGRQQLSTQIAILCKLYGLVDGSTMESNASSHACSSSTEEVDEKSCTRRKPAACWKNLGPSFQTSSAGTSHTYIQGI